MGAERGRSVSRMMNVLLPYYCPDEMERRTATGQSQKWSRRPGRGEAQAQRESECRRAAVGMPLWAGRKSTSYAGCPRAGAKYWPGWRGGGRQQ